jgi:hypoxanthine-DNA glycosylase
MFKSSFDAIADENSRVLILGTLPGNESLRTGQYYANPSNQFWSLIMENKYVSSYETRKQFLLNNHIAIWDVLQKANRIGSLDKNIFQEIPNDFDTFFADHPNIQYVFFNGKKAKGYFERYCPRWMITKTCKTLPSSSSALEMNFMIKKTKWQDALRVLKNESILD